MKNPIFIAGCLILTLACNLGVPAPGTASPPPASPLSTPQPVTVAPEIPFTAAVSATPEPPPYYFTDEFDAPSPYWSVYQTAGVLEPRTSFENGALRIDLLTPDTWSIAVHTAHTYLNVSLRARVSATPSGSVGLLCRYDEQDGWYEFNVSSEGVYNVLYGKWLAPGIVQYVPMISEASGLLSAGRLDYELMLSCQDNFIHLYVNDRLLRRLDVTNYGLTEGGVGVTASSHAQAPMSVFFEWTRIESE
jgi:hypothetical protein